ncbi:DUF1775 domain-containing protein [Pseudonocardia zijingensis]|jgi:uncharacterized protein YcnI|uniref:YncI copper-binding domain-containing protein n=1 Tax=Pseudonocardia zijingensis TaxID=153376 RepID=A0ABN1NX05_9PSEU
MACNRRSIPHVLATAFTTLLVCVLGTLLSAPEAAARVTVVPGAVTGGGTETFAVRLSNEQSDLVTTRLELTFPEDVVVPLAEVTAVGKWKATVSMRRVDPPVTIEGKEVDTAVESIVWTGGKVGPKQFEQFLVTAGPLPAEGGDLVLAAAQGYADGSVDRWTAPARPGWPGAPVITIAADPAAAPTGPAPADAPAAPQPSAAAAAPAAQAEPATRWTSVLPWVLLVAGVLVAGVGSVVGYQQQERRKRVAERRRTRAARHRLDVTKIEELPTGAGRR